MDTAITYEAPAECPAEAAFRADVTRRVPDAKQRGDQSFVVRIRSNDGFDGHLTIVDQDEERARDVHGATCGEVAQALALAIATALEPDEPSRETKVAPSRRPSPAASDRARDAGAAAATTPIARHVSAGAMAGVVNGLGPLVAPEVALFGEHAWGARALRGSLAVAFGSAIPGGDAHGVLRRGAVRAEGCPLAWELGRVTPSLCASLEEGFLSASGAGVTAATTVIRPWAAAGAEGRVRFAVAGPMFVEIEARVAFPFWRDQFFFRPSTDIYTVPPVTFSALAGVGARFW